MHTAFASIDEAIVEIRKGNMVIVVDDDDRENEGDLVMAAEMVTAEKVNFMVTHGRGLLCQAITAKRAEELNLGFMAPRNTALHRTAFTVSVDARGLTSTGISASDRAATIRAIVTENTRAEDLLRPGHVFPLVARDGGVLERNGHTEAAVDLARLGGFTASGVLCEIMDDDGTMARLQRLEGFAERFGLRIVRISDMVRYRELNDPIVTGGGSRRTATQRISESDLPTEFGGFRIVTFVNEENPQIPHVALVAKRAFDVDNALVRLQSECLTGEAFLSRRCDCGFQLREAMARISREGGAIVYLRQEGRGIGLGPKIRAYGLQDEGYDTVEANVRLGYHADERDFSAGANILRALGITGVRLLTNNPEKVAALARGGILVRERISLEAVPVRENRRYLFTKKKIFGHLLEHV